MIEQEAAVETPVEEKRRKRFDDDVYDAMHDFLVKKGVRVLPSLEEYEISFKCDSQEEAFEIGDIALSSGISTAVHLIGIWGRRKGEWRIFKWRMSL